MSRGGLGAVGAISELRDIEIELENPRLREVSLELPGDEKLADFAHRVSRRREIEVLRQLLGDRRTAARDFAFVDALLDDLFELFRVDSFMLVETAVLGDDHRATEPGGDSADRYPSVVDPVVLPFAAQARLSLFHERGRLRGLRRERRNVGKRNPQPGDCRREEQADRDQKSTNHRARDYTPRSFDFREGGHESSPLVESRTSGGTQ